MSVHYSTEITTGTYDHYLFSSIYKYIGCDHNYSLSTVTLLIV